jgi:NADP-dependent 3-hydroxy acid dehydrogenase YdfG
MMTETFANQNIVIIGGSSGIGLAVAKLVAQQGAKVTIVSRSKERLEKAANEIGGDVQIGIINTLDENSVKEFFANLDPIDHLLCFAGDSMRGGVMNSDITTAKNAMQSKFWGQFYIGRYGSTKINTTGSLTFTAGSGPRPHQAIATVVANAGVSLLA